MSPPRVQRAEPVLLNILRHRATTYDTFFGPTECNKETSEIS
jgi:hypothetical protein